MFAVRIECFFVRFQKYKGVGGESATSDIISDCVKGVQEKVGIKLLNDLKEITLQKKKKKRKKST